MIRKSGYRFSEKIMLHQKVIERNRFNLKSARQGCRRSKKKEHNSRRLHLRDGDVSGFRLLRQ
jgi:hypothetical protein